jgi:hypothetical protein
MNEPLLGQRHDFYWKVLERTGTRALLAGNVKQLQEIRFE